MTLAALDAEARKAGLAVRGAFHPGPSDHTPPGTGTLVLLGPDEPAFWPRFTASPEYGDGAPDPLDRWSKRVTVPLAQAWGGTAFFPSDGPPYPPFLHWAERSGAAWPSPVGLLVHHCAGLFISYRAAVALPDRLALPPAPVSPCTACRDKPCLSACPVGALTADANYDVAGCKKHITTAEGASCLSKGCLVRRSCPVSRDYGRDPEQSAFHMAAFLGDWVQQDREAL